ncbi:MAG: hypothetical protein GY861_22020 [bacterium]|nr:hypothetical protein [bacterium]
MEGKNSKSFSNLLYFEAYSVRELYKLMRSWQSDHRREIPYFNIVSESDFFSCVAVAGKHLSYRRVC